jgi:hypothetical protein
VPSHDPHDIALWALVPQVLSHLSVRPAEPFRLFAINERPPPIDLIIALQHLTI